MKLKLKEIHPNPFKQWINEGNLNEEQIEKLSSSEEEIGLMGSIPLVKRGKKHHSVSHHHRIEMLKRKHGEDHEVEVVLHDYNDEQLMRGMVVENLTQRQGEFREELENLVAIRKFLSRETDSDHGKKQTRDEKGKFEPVSGSTKDIEDWLNKHGEIMSLTKIKELLRINDKLSEELKQEVEIKGNGDALSKTQAVMLSSIDDEDEQKDLAKALKSSKEDRVREQGKLLSKYKSVDEEEKQKIRSGEKDLTHVGIETSDVVVEKKTDAELQTVYDLMADYSSKIQDFREKVADDLADEKKQELAEYLVSFRNNVLNDLITYLMK